MKFLQILIFITIFFIFIYLRLTPIINQTVPYTYDQGRDFLKAAEIVKDKNLTFIGPTTGIMGVFHGAWWYYFLTVPYIIFQGWPVGFYLFMFFVSTLSIILFYFFVKKEFGLIPSLLFLLIISASSFFIRLAFFVSNNTISPLFVLLFIYSVYQYLKTNSKKYLFLISFSFGFIFEFEVAFGLFIIASFIVASLFFKEFRKDCFNIKKLPYFLGGFLIPILPRVLFEIKNNFIQSKAFINFFINPNITNQQGFLSAAFERFGLFFKYYQQLFLVDNKILFFLFLAIILIFIINRVKETKKYLIKSLTFFSFLMVSIFTLTLLNKNNFFWDHYLDGVQFILLFIIIIIFSFKQKNRFFNVLKLVIVLMFFLLNLSVALPEMFKKNSVPLIGLKADDKIVNHFVSNTNNQHYCLRIYTPPVIPYTYNYLFSYYAKMGRVKYPSGDFINNKCYFLIDKEPYQFRVDKWKEENIPKKTKIKEIKKFENGSVIKFGTVN